MRLPIEPGNESRVVPMLNSEVPATMAAALEPWRRRGRLSNIFLTLAQHPALLNAWLPFGSYTFNRSTLPPRERELIILRTAWRCGCRYEIRHHTRLARRAGLTTDELERVALEPSAPGWLPPDTALLQAVDELESDVTISEATWSALSESLDQRQIMDVVYTFGAYRATAAAMNSFGVLLDDGSDPTPASSSDREVH